MSEIKFRAWCEVDMGTSGIRKFMETQIKEINLEPTDDCPKGEFIGEKGIWCGIHESVLMQHTGFNDKNSEEIYNKDIVEERRKGLAAERYIVVWDSEKGSWMLESKSGARYGIGAINQRNFEVIGNIYENPELMGGNTK